MRWKKKSGVDTIFALLKDFEIDWNLNPPYNQVILES